MIAFRKYKIVERDKFVIAEARKILINNPQIVLQGKLFFKQKKRI